jgi:hypothetical protein
MRTWLHSCNIRHRNFSELANVGSETVMPTRLLKIEPESDTVYLVEPTKPHSYALLSYCWGGNQDTKTTVSNLSSYRREIRISTLPQTSRDAIDVTKLLRIEYLWVNALCM